MTSTHPIVVQFPFYRKKTDHLGTDHFLQMLTIDEAIIISVPMNLQNIGMKTKRFTKPYASCEKRATWATCKDGWLESDSVTFYEKKIALRR